MNSLAAKRAMSSYQKVERTKRDTNNPQELVGLLFTGLTDRIASARKALAENDRTTRAEQVTKAQKILFGLCQTLDFEKGGELARNLFRLYDYSINKLSEGHAQEDEKCFEEVHDLISTVRNAWTEMPSVGNTNQQ